MSFRTSPKLPSVKKAWGDLVTTLLGKLIANAIAQKVRDNRTAIIDLSNIFIF
jgi:hypothetical protein